MMTNEEGKKLSLFEAVALGVGTMIGASIFSIFGLGAEIAGSNLPEAFLISSLLAFMVAYSYVKLSKKITSNAGAIEFILKGIGDNLATGTLSILMWLSYVISIALFVKGFAGYLLPLIGISSTPLSIGIVEVFVIIFFTFINFFGSKAVGRLELVIVLVKLAILGLLVLAGFIYINPGLVKPSFEGRYLDGMMFATVIFFLSYMGFGLITNASENIKDPKRNVPKAIYLSILIVTLVYVTVAITVVGNLPLEQIIQAKENALAEAAKPALGQIGFVIISIGALFSISSALNATLYGGANVSYSLAKDGELPEFFERKSWFKSTEGLYITALVSLVFALLFDMRGIASITSAVFMSIYLFVIFSHYKLVEEVGGKKYVIIINLISVLVAFIVLLYYQWKTQVTVLYATMITFSLSLLAEYLYRLFSRRKFIRR